jgi:XTP/dITP diphosphohydrolase
VGEPVTLVFATRNAGKMKEVKQILAESGEFEPISLEEAGIGIEVVEDGGTFEENAVKKAVEIMKACGELTLADDSGIEIDFLGKGPGVFSSRYLGEDTPYGEKNRLILNLLEKASGEERSARFVCVIAAAFPDGRVIARRAAMEGFISTEARGSGGFGYDPIFYVPEAGMTSAELSPEEKNRLSHRGKALRAMREALLKELEK